LGALAGFSFLLVPVALILSIIGLFSPLSRRQAVIGLVLAGALPLLLFLLKS
jgi:hypothetical protein